MFEVVVSDRFAAAHQLQLKDGTLEPLHGHNWNVKVTYTGDRLDETGVLIDFVAVRTQLSEVIATLHERHLNEMTYFRERGPSAEYVAIYIAEHMTADGGDGARLAAVEVEEETGCFARYVPPPA